MDKPQFLVKKIAFNKTENFHSSDSKGKGKVSGSVGVILVTLLMVSILFGAIRRNQLQLAKNEAEVRSQVEHQLNEASSIFLLNPVRARELIISARSILNSYNSKDSKFTKDLINKVEDAERLILGDYKKDPQLFFDLTLFSEGFTGSKLFIEGDNLYVFDENAKKIVSVNTDSKRSEVVAGPSLVGSANQIIPFANDVLYLNETGVYGLDGKKLLDQSFGDGIIATQFGGNLYVLNPNESQIYRYPGTFESFSEGKTWIDEGSEVNLSGAKTLAIDGFLWILSEGNQIIKLSQGKKVGFSIKGFDMGSFHPTALYVNETSKYLYILDSKIGKILVTEKDGAYKAQYTSEALKEISDFSVYEKNKKAFLLTGEKLLYLDLDHL